MIQIEHGRDAIKTEAVEMVFLQPEFQIAQKEVNHFRLAVIEALGAPGGMITPTALMEELIGGAVEEVDALQSVADGVGVNNIQQDTNAHAVGLVDEIHQIFRCAESAGGGVETADLVAEGTVEGVLHNCHQLDGVVAKILHMGQNVIGKLTIGGNFVFLAGHTYMSLIDQRGLITMKVSVCPGVGIDVVPHFAAPAARLPVLRDTAGIEGNMLGEMIAVLDDGENSAALMDGVTREGENPVAVVGLFHRGGCPLPVVEITCQKQLIGTGCPLTVNPAVFRFVEAIPVICVGKITQGSFAGQNLFCLLGEQIHAQLKVALKGAELRELLQDRNHKRYSPLRNIGSGIGCIIPLFNAFDKSEV